MTGHANADVKQAVRDRYARAAEGSGCCEPTCCGSETETELKPDEISRTIGYSEEGLAHVPEDANLGLGCGNPTAIASLTPGQTVLDLGSGAGIDCFLAAVQVGSECRVIGVDMTHEMIDKARANAENGSYDNVEFRLGEIEALPVADATVDVIVSNCVLNLSRRKDKGVGRGVARTKARGARGGLRHGLRSTGTNGTRGQRGGCRCVPTDVPRAVPAAASGRGVR